MNTSKNPQEARSLLLFLGQIICLAIGFAFLLATFVDTHDPRYHAQLATDITALIACVAGNICLYALPHLVVLLRAHRRMHHAKVA